MLLWNIETDKRCIAVDLHQLLAFLNLQQHEKNRSFHQFILDSFRVTWPDWSHPFLTMSTKKYFDQLYFMWVCINLQKIQKNSLICSGDIVDFKILQFDWLRIFWPISQEQKFSQIWFLCKNTANNISFHYRVNSVKINQQIFQ